MNEPSDLDESIDAYLKEWSEWVREHDQWMNDVKVWDKRLRQLLLLIHELDEGLPNEQQRLSSHVDEIHKHLDTLESHGKCLNQLKLMARASNTAAKLPLDIKNDHSKLKFEHARVRDVHAGLRHQHQEAMDRVNNLMGNFKQRLEG